MSLSSFAVGFQNVNKAYGAVANSVYVYGTMLTGSGYKTSVSDYIEIPQNAKLIELSNEWTNTEYNEGVFFFDENKTEIYFLSSIHSSTLLHSIPSNAKYIRCCYLWTSYRFYIDDTPSSVVGGGATVDVDLSNVENKLDNIVFHTEKVKKGQQYITVTLIAHQNVVLMKIKIE